MKSLFFPTKKNKHHAYLLRKPMLALYLVILIIVNMIFGGLSMTYSKAAVDFTTLYAMHNEERAKRNLSELTINPLLINSATAKAKEMLVANCWSHYCPEGKSPWDFFDAAGYVYVYAGENLAEGFVDNNAVMNAWLDSPTHRENILNAKFTEIGIGFAQGDYQGIDNNTIIVVHFGNRFDLFTNAQQVLNDSDSNSEEIKINAPQDGDAFRDNTFEIKGQANSLDAVDIFANNDEIGTAKINQGVFTYKPSDSQFVKEGQYKLKATGELFGETITSNIVSIDIDKTPPSLNLSNLKISKSISGYLFEMNVKDAEHLKIVNLNLDFQKSSNDLWQVFVEDFLPEKVPSLIISAADKAGNANSLEVRTSNVLNEGGNDTVDEAQFLNGSPLFRFKNQTSIVNFSFLIFMSGLFGIDYLILQKDGRTGNQRSKSHLNILLFIVLAIIVLLGSASGDILTGLLIN